MRAALIPWLMVACTQPPEPATLSVIEGDAPEIRSWSASMDCCGEDPHPVHGAVLPDGSVVMVGKAVDGGQTRGFATRWLPPRSAPEGRFVDDAPDVIAATQLLDRDSALLQVTATADAVVAVGFTAGSASDNSTAVALALDPDTLAIRARLEMPAAENSSVFESVVTRDEGRTLVFGGARNFERREMEGFKSYGNVYGGEGVVVAVDLQRWLERGAATTAPADIGATIHGLPEVFSAKSMRALPDGDLAVVGAAPDEVSGLLRVSAPLDEHAWIPRDPDVELTDVQVLDRPEGSAIAVVGHGGDGVIDGQATLLDDAGQLLWHLPFGDPGVDPSETPVKGLAPDAFIFDECWGATQRGDTLVVACGTGIESCGEVAADAESRSLCRSDPRRAWRSFVVALHPDGTVAWSRADSLVDQDGSAYESAAEFIVSDASGDLYVVVDHAVGVGLLRLGE